MLLPETNPNLLVATNGHARGSETTHADDATGPLDDAAGTRIERHIVPHDLAPVVEATTKGLSDAQFDRAFGEKFGVVVRFLRARRISEDKATDLAQSSFVRLWEHRAEIRDPKHVVSWLISAAWNEFLSGVRRESSYRPLVGDRKAEPWEEDWRIIKVKEALDDLPRGQRQIIEARLNGESYADIAVKIRASLDTVYGNASKGCAALRKHIDARSSKVNRRDVRIRDRRVSR
jgi:RNA polymerase sigma factor (sigma-70 family)